MIRNNKYQKTSGMDFTSCRFNEFSAFPKTTPGGPLVSPDNRNSSSRCTPRGNDKRLKSHGRQDLKVLRIHRNACQTSFNTTQEHEMTNGCTNLIEWNIQAVWNPAVKTHHSRAPCRRLSPTRHKVEAIVM